MRAKRPLTSSILTEVDPLIWPNLALFLLIWVNILLNRLFSI
jgi:hypothetical protein